MTDTNIHESVPLIFRPSQVPTRKDNRSQFQKKLAVWFILLAVGFERLAFYSLGGNLVLFLTSHAIRWTSLHSVNASLLFFGTSYISALIFSWISDAKLDRAKTILLGFTLYSIGYIFFPLFSHKHIFTTLCGHEPEYQGESIPYFKEKCSGPITAALIITATGVGAVQANMAVFGAEQVREQKSTTQYFDKYYAVVNVGGLLAFAVVAYVQQNIQWFIGHTISAGLLVFTWILFLLGYKYYIHIKAHDSVISNFFPVLINAFQTWRKYRQHTRRIAYNGGTFDRVTLLKDQDDANDNSSHEIKKRPKSFLDYAKVVYNGRFHDRVVDDIKALGRIIVMFLLLIPYWLIYIQNDTTFIVQGVHMNVPKIPQVKNHMPLLWLSLADQLIIIVTIFILNTCVYKRLRASNRIFSMKVRMVIGMLVATISMCITGMVEIFRQHTCDLPLGKINQTIGNTTYIAANMSVFYQLPQIFAIGFSEVFTSVASLEFAYLAAPQSAQSLVMSFRFTTAGLSSFLGSAYINIYQGIYKNFTVINSECKDTANPELFSIYFFILAGIQLIFIFIFLGCDHRFQILKATRHRFNTRLFIGSYSET